MKLSICIPVYNSKNTISKCLDSIEKQTQKPFEVVVVDDCSTDGSVAQIEAFIERSKLNIRLVNNEVNLGLSKNWNKAIATAQGDVVSLMHQDDWYNGEEVFAAVLDEFKGNNKLSLLALPANDYDDDGVYIKSKPWIRPNEFKAEDYFKYQMDFIECPPPSQCFMRVSDLAIENNAYYLEHFEYCPELDLYIRMALKNTSGVFKHSNNPLLNIGRTSSENQFSKKYWHKGILDKHRIFYKYLVPLKEQDYLTKSKNKLRKSLVKGTLKALLRGQFANSFKLFKQLNVLKYD